ncbi:MAG: DUF1573 domain-containing protein [Bacteroidetes bacterium]|nr:DUF1573 domain-containing protein [Bacteroidota bacterium]
MTRQKILSLVLILISISSFSQSGKKKITLYADEQSNIKFNEKIHDFGKITEGTKATYEFIYTNNGKAPLIITDVITPCSCTSPDWSKEPLLPGKSSKIKVVFDSKNKPGTFNKTITVKHNGASGTEYLIIKGVVSN